MGLRTKAIWVAMVVAVSSGCVKKVDCAVGTQDCGGVCVTLSADNLNCGVCGNVCGIGTVCAAGQCAAACPDGQIACGGACVDTLTNSQHCGGCNHPCPNGTTCAFPGKCGCPDGRDPCGGTCCAESEFCSSDSCQ